MHPALGFLLLASGLAAIACGGNVVVDNDARSSDGAGAAGGIVTSGGTGGAGAGNSGSSSGAGGAGSVPEGVRRACPEIADQPLVCVANSEHGMLVVSPSDGRYCSLYGANENGSNSLGVIGNHVHWCGYTQVERRAFDDPTLDFSAPYSCDAVTSWGDKLLVLRGFDSGFQELETFGSFEEIGVVEPESTTSFGRHPFMISGGANSLYSAWHADDVISEHALPDLAPRPDIHLQGYDDWIYGMWANEVDGTMLLLDDSATFYTFDRQTGALLSRVPVDSTLTQMRGFHCWRNPV
ncbi:hypothetical protein [Chondromyces crocatus]|nr:hypothetical protein [Chondromyces crocatus]